MRALFANYFCHFLPKTFLCFVLHIAEYRIDQSTYAMSMGSTKLLTAIFKNFGLFVLLGPFSRVVTISKIPDVHRNVIHK